MKSKLMLAGIGVMVGLAALAVAMFIVSAQQYAMHGSVIEPAVPAPALVLKATNGNTFDLAQQHGKLLLVFFGYTSCPDVCPATLAQLRQVVTQLGTQAGEVQVVFVTVDPDRDTLETMQRYISAFTPAFTGLTGTEDQLDPVWTAYGVYHKIRPNSTHPENYTVDHSTFVYLIDPKGRLRLTYPIGTNVDDMVQDIKHLLKEG
jgi:protein SCO1/2